LLKDLEIRLDLDYICNPTKGGLAHLVERLHGMQKVTGSIPVSSTKNLAKFAGFFYA
jgi:hypothetical protein